MELPVRHDAVLSVEGTPLAVGLGGGQVSLIDLEQEAVVDVAGDIGGRVLDATMSPTGNRVLAAVDVFPPGLIDIEVDVRRRRLRGAVRGANVLVSPAGIALDRRNRIAFVVSSETTGVVAFDLDNGRSDLVRSTNDRPIAMASPTGVAAYSDELGGFFAVRDFRDASMPRVFPYSVSGRAAGFDGIPTFFGIAGIATDGPGRRVLLAGAGTSTLTSGLTAIAARFNELSPAATSTLYPRDPVDRGGGFDEPLRYQPRGIAIVYGQ
ncbi:MAG: hypothetical protein HC923_02350 [Myxococcales bacterium]|nr:hypothetical protein [Myxococcales bacterium]